MRDAIPHRILIAVNDNEGYMGHAMTDGVHMGQDPDEAAYLERREIERLEGTSSNRVRWSVATPTVDPDEPHATRNRVRCGWPGHEGDIFFSCDLHIGHPGWHLARWEGRVYQWPADD